MNKGKAKTKGLKGIFRSSQYGWDSDMVSSISTLVNSGLIVQDLAFLTFYSLYTEETVRDAMQTFLSNRVVYNYMCSQNLPFKQ